MALRRRRVKRRQRRSTTTNKYQSFWSDVLRLTIGVYKRRQLPWVITDSDGVCRDPRRYRNWQEMYDTIKAELPLRTDSVVCRRVTPEDDLPTVWQCLWWVWKHELRQRRLNT